MWFIIATSAFSPFIVMASFFRETVFCIHTYSQLALAENFLSFFTHLKHYLTDGERIQPITEQQKLYECFQLESRGPHGKQGSQAVQTTDHFVKETMPRTTNHPHSLLGLPQMKTTPQEMETAPQEMERLVLLLTVYRLDSACFDLIL